VTESDFTDGVNPEGDGTVLIEPSPSGAACPIIAPVRFTG
jgi:hypothetical protein